MQSEGDLKVRDRLRTKEDCVRAIKKFHMENFVDHIVDHTDAERYVILYRNELCMFWLATSYMKRSDSWEISSMDPPHNFTTTKLVQDRRKLSSKIICQDIMPLVSKDPSVKVTIIISHIITRYNYIPSYKKAWVARTKIVLLTTLIELVIKRLRKKWKDV